MFKNLFKRLRGDRIYFAIVFFILILIFISGIATPYLIHYLRDNWVSELQSRIKDIEVYVNNSLDEKENNILKNLDWLKKNLSSTLKSNTYQYRELVRLVNQPELQDYSLEVVAPNGKLIAWNENLAIKQEEIFPLAYPLGETYFYSNGLLTYLTITDTVEVQNDVFYVIVSKLVEKGYYLQNEFYSRASYSKEIAEKFFTQCIIDYNPFTAPPKDGRVYSFNLINYKGTKIGQVNIFKPSLNISVENIKETSAKIQGVLAVLACLFITLGFRKDFLSIKNRFVRWLILIISLSMIRLLFFVVGFPSVFLSGSLVDPSYFSSTFAWGLVKSPAEFFVTNLFVIVIAIQLLKYIYNFVLHRNTKRLHFLKILAVPILAVALYYLLRGLSAAVKSVIFDSSIRYFRDPTPIPDLNIIFMNLNVLMLGSAIVMVMTGFILLIGKFLKLLDSKENSGLKAVIFFLLLGIGGYFFFKYQPEPLIIQPMVVLFILLVFILAYIAYFKSRIFVQVIIYVTITSSIITVSLMNYFNLSLERQSLKTVAFEIIRANENLLNYMLDETLRNSLKDDKLVNNFYRTNVNYDAEAFRVWAESPMQREAINSAVFLYDPELKMLGKFSVGIESELSLSEILDSLRKDEQQTFSILKDENSDEKIFVGVVPVIKKDLIAGYIAAVVKFDIQNIGSRNFPDFLESNKTLLGSVIDVSLLKIFEFKNGKVSQVYGDIYPSREQMDDIFNAKLSKFNDAWISFRIFNEDYFAYVIKLINDEQERIITVAAKEKEITWNLFNFFKIFLIHSIIIIVLFVILILTKLLKIQYTFRSKLLLALLVVSIIPIATLAIYNRQVVSEKSEKAIFAELSRRSDYLEKHVRAQLEKHSERNLITAFKNAGKELDISFVVFDNSSLIYSSRENIYNTGLFSNKLLSKAHYKLNYLSYREYLSKENVDKFSYDAYYRKVRINGVPLILGVNDAFNKIKPVLSTADIDVILFGVYSFAVILIIIVSMLLASQISAPIRRLTKATEAVAQGDLDVKLDNKEKGEMKDLFDGFNSMTNELQKNQVELAELEREAAWKEMAKQVAHEIKNPLTPIKLAIQQLVASYKEKKNDFDSIFDKVTTTTLTQIDNLSQIASEFSSFAKMPSIKLEIFDAVPILRETINLFYDEKVNIDFDSEEKTAVIEADASQVRRMVINLIRNSIQANATDISIRLIARGNDYSLTVADNGEGIKEKYKNKIFEMNFTTKEKGMGLGLKLAKRFLEGVGGHIRLISTGPSGTTFEILIPRFQAEEIT